MADTKLPRASYLVCATQRSGSTFLCEALGRTGVAGEPEEYFEGETGTRLPRAPREWFRGLDDRDFVSGLSAHWGPPHTAAMSALAGTSSYSDYMAWVFEHGTTSNGVFGAKMMWSYLHDFAEQARESAHRDRPVSELLDSVFPSLRYVWVTRRDKVRQAVSLWKAVQTETWKADVASDGHARREPVFNFEAIDHLRHQMAEHDAGWCAYFYRSGKRPLTIVYEDFESDYEATITRILEHIGATVAALPEPPTAKQADTRSEEWIEYYRRLDEERATSSRGPRRPFPLRPLPSGWPATAP